MEVIKDGDVTIFKCGKKRVKKKPEKNIKEAAGTAPESIEEVVKNGDEEN